jgi:hypothetical protein
MRRKKKKGEEKCKENIFFHFTQLNVERQVPFFEASLEPEMLREGGKKDTNDSKKARS